MTEVPKRHENAAMAGFGHRPEKLNVDPVPLDATPTEFEVVRALQRCVRARHDGQCPSCGYLTVPNAMCLARSVGGNCHTFDYRCPNCAFEIEAEEVARICEMFQPYLARSAEVLLQWRKGGHLTPAQAARDMAERSCGSAGEAQSTKDDI
jgi:hypothetical protein